MFQMGSVHCRGGEVGGPEGPDGGRALPAGGQHLDFQAIQGGRPQVGHGEHVVIRRQDLGLGDDAVGQAVLSALCRDLSPSHLEPSHGLVEIGLAHLPRKAAGDVHILDDERSRKVLRFGKYFGEDGT